MRLRNVLLTGLLAGLCVALSACATGPRTEGMDVHDDEMLPGRQVRLSPDHVVEYRVMFFVNRRDESERELYDEAARDPKIEETHAIYLPFLEIVQYDPAIASPQAERAIEDGMNPLARVFPFDQPLLELWSRKSVAITQLAEGTEVTREAGRRIRVLDTLPVGLFQHDRWLGGQSHMEILQLPLFSVGYACRESATESNVRVVEVPLVKLFRHRNNASGRRTRVGDATLASVFERMKDPLGNERWGLVNVPFIALAMYEETVNGRAFTMLGTAAYDSWLPDWTGEPLIALWHQTQSQGRMSQQALRLPLLGPVWAWWKAPVEEEGADWETHWSIFPRITHWKSFEH